MFKGNVKGFFWFRIDNDDLAPFLRPTQFKTRVKKPSPLGDKNSEINTLFLTKNSSLLLYVAIFVAESILETKNRLKNGKINESP